ncbi:ABC transporter permease [Pseudomonas fluorescens]|uniref:ABC transporter permease n=1 Tax=Pseudomonas fluorescens TaxID=294 RepID=A0A944DXG4_PSEFL|nr:ABC transporter permease [Pseudomonas fluorescens]MBT2297845.1 ABC transporter permease [Pseudomonas fluorescens]MBT2308136.1 ABC transporter permease [Pseudomonas fluorescens]MBT2315072.1 ABC transporter permease [Pseudomonas fluorescens]MBT2320618.1 ABC transporter permease [Pseudomonas fluorescens]MBT2328761.1 ABC transporter permease [Pseudomonas fluorescens]
MLKRNQWRWVERDFFTDVRVLVSQRKLAWLLYLADIAENKRNSGLGLIAPFISVFIHVLLLGSVMGLVFNEPLVEFIPFFAVSFSIWQGISIFVSDISYSNDKAMRYISFPNISGFISNLVSAYEFTIALVLKICGSFAIILFVNPTIVFATHYLAFVAGLFLLTLVLLTWSLPLAYLFDRVRILRGFLPQILFATYLLTPILWTPDRLSSHRWVVDFNPVFHLIELARVPIIDAGVPLTSILVSLGLIAMGIIMSYLLFPANRSLIVYRWMS